jgi:hypothetical protein
MYVSTLEGEVTTLLKFWGTNYPAELLIEASDFYSGIVLV